MNADGNVIKIKHDVLFEVAKLAFAGELEEQRDPPPAEAYSRDRHRSSAAVSTKSVRSSARESASQKAKLRDRKMMAISSRLFLLPAKTVRSPATQ